ncbi:MAG TPA: sigma-70 family RNA polymerase sigma factor [Bacteroidia bacterium]|nr:sigma-70 family RNA polymerase sigma factor [Bacteroidia bacterium]
MNGHHKTDEALREEQQQVESAKADPSKFGVLYEKYYRQIFVFVFRRTNDDEIAGDIVSNTFLKAMLSLKSYTFKGVPFSAWLFRIALNEVNLFFRKTKRERVVSLDRSGIVSVIAESGQEDSEGHRILLMKILGTLPAEEMQLIELRFFEKRPFSEVGEILGITENNAKVKTYRILDKMKQTFNRFAER